MPTRAELLGLVPPLAADHAAVIERLWAGVLDPVVLELCRLRLAMLLGSRVALAERTPQAVAAGLDEAQVEKLSQWPTDPAFDQTQRAALAYAEQWLIDIHGVTDEQSAELCGLLGEPAMLVLTTALALWDGQHRFDNALEVNP